jgi:HAMP domain-containing protein
VLSSYGPLDLNSLRWAVIAEIDEAEAYKPIYDYARNAVLATTALAIGTTILALLSSWLLVRPLKQLSVAARKISAGDTTVSVDLHTRDEFGELARVFNDMSANLRRQRADLEEKARENQELLLNILPASAIEQRRGGDEKATRQFADVTVLVADFGGIDALGGRGNDSRASGEGVAASPLLSAPHQPPLQRSTPTFSAPMHQGQPLDPYHVAPPGASSPLPPFKTPPSSKRPSL